MPQSAGTDRHRPVRLWWLLEEGAGTAMANQDSRRQRRLKVALKACVRLGGREDVVQVLDTSRGGIRFRSALVYVEPIFVEVAMPYTEGSENFFVSGRIVWRHTAQPGEFEY